MVVSRVGGGAVGSQYPQSGEGNGARGPQAGGPVQNAGHDNHTNYYFGPVSNGGPAPGPDGGQGDGAGGRRRRVLLGSGAATVLVALIGAAVTLVQPYLPGGGTSGASAVGTGTAPAHAAAPTRGGSSAPAQGGGQASSAPAAAPSTPAAGTLQWQGALVLGPVGYGDKDLDAAEPVHSQTDTDNDLAVNDYRSIGMDLSLVSNDMSDISVWTDGSRLPGYGDCASTVDAGGTQKQTLRQGAVLCVRTPQGHVARLVVRSIATDMTDTEVTFAAVVWSAPAGGSAG